LAGRGPWASAIGAGRCSRGAVELVGWGQGWGNGCWGAMCGGFDADDGRWVDG
jgi:hypothetical protein